MNTNLFLATQHRRTGGWPDIVMQVPNKEDRAKRVVPKCARAQTPVWAVLMSSLALPAPPFRTPGLQCKLLRQIICKVTRWAIALRTCSTV